MAENNEGVKAQPRMGSSDKIDRTQGCKQSHPYALLTIRYSAAYGFNAASVAEISAVAAGVPQLGASEPSPQLRGR